MRAVRRSIAVVIGVVVMNWAALARAMPCGVGGLMAAAGGLGNPRLQKNTGEDPVDGSFEGATARARTNESQRDQQTSYCFRDHKALLGNRLYRDPKLSILAAPSLGAMRVPNQRVL